MTSSTRTFRLAATWVALFAAAALGACRDSTGPNGPATTIRALTSPTVTANAGASVTDGVSVRILDARGHNLPGTKVAFAITRGEGAVSRRLVVSDADGVARVDWTLSQAAGANELQVSTLGLDTTVTFTGTGVAGPAAGVAITPHTLRMAVGTNSATVTASIVDQFGNPVTGSTTSFTSKNTGVVNVSTGGTVDVVSRSATTYVVAGGGAFKDSSYVVVLGSGDPNCFGITATAPLAVGDVMTTGFSDNGVCIPAGVGSREYALVPYFDSSVPSALTTVTMNAFGASTPGALGGAVGSAANAGPVAESGRPALASAFHDRLRVTESHEVPGRAADARQWYSRRAAGPPGGAALRSTAGPAVGDQLTLNVNATDFCSTPKTRTGHVVAVTTRAVVVADNANPAGFTDAEYTSIGVTFDTLVYALDVANFGAPTDIDNNGGRFLLFFTHAVNEIAGSNTLGYFYSRDLLPKSGPLGSCPGSNVAEMMYLLVPDDVTSKTFVATNTVGTIAHEFQHLINGSRRLYVNTDAAPDEERWLNEGLSHVAEELMFYRTSGRAPRQNIGSSIFSAPELEFYQSYQANNFGRLREYLKAPDSQAPIGTDDNDDDTATRGAIWSLLRYAADQRFSTNEQSFWYNLVNANSTGLTSLTTILGSDARVMMRDWALSIFLDGLVATAPKYQQPSWALRAAMPNYAPATQNLTASAKQVQIKAGGMVFGRFALANGVEGYVTANGVSTTPLPKNVLLALVRTK